MTQHDDSAYLGHMYEMSATVLGFAEGKTFSDLESDYVVQFAIVHALQIVGEAARRVSQETKDSIPEIEWRLIIGMRHRIVHDYFDVDINVVWDTITNDIPNLMRVLSHYAPAQPYE